MPNLVASGNAVLAPAGTTVAPEPPFTVNQIPGLGKGTQNASPA